MGDTANRDRRLQRYWDKQADGYDRQLAWLERRHFADTRSWLCGRASGETLEVAVGTGLNLEHYPAGVSLTGIEWSESMLSVARRRADALPHQVTLRQADARDLPFGDAHFDTVLATFSLCGIPDPGRALEEMKRVLRPGGLLLLADHVASSALPIRALQRVVDVFTVPLQGERYSHRPLPAVLRMGFVLEAHERGRFGLIERLAARRPPS